MKKRVALALVAMLAVPGSALAIGAIAIDDRVGEDEPAYGFSINQETKEAAKSIARRYCEEYGGTQCRAVVWFETCGAVAVSKKHYGYGYGRSKDKAMEDALDMCEKKSCKIVVAKCE